VCSIRCHCTVFLAVPWHFVWSLRCHGTVLIVVSWHFVWSLRYNGIVCGPYCAMTLGDRYGAMALWSLRCHGTTQHSSKAQYFSRNVVTHLSNGKSVGAVPSHTASVSAVKRVPSRASPCGICGTPELYSAPASTTPPNLLTCHRQYVTLTINSVVK
jgi:hypothetical protein